MKVRALKLKDARFPADEGHLVTEGTLDYSQIVKKPKWFHDWISFDCLLADDKRNTIWCGITAFDANIFWAYDRKTGKFRDMKYSKVGDRFDAKFHRSLLFDKQGMIWAATALLHDMDNYHAAPGGAIVRGGDGRPQRFSLGHLPFRAGADLDLDNGRRLCPRLRPLAGDPALGRVCPCTTGWVPRRSDSRPGKCVAAGPPRHRPCRGLAWRDLSCRVDR